MANGHDAQAEAIAAFVDADGFDDVARRAGVIRDVLETWLETDEAFRMKAKRAFQQRAITAQAQLSHCLRDYLRIARKEFKSLSGRHQPQRASLEPADILETVQKLERSPSFGRLIQQTERASWAGLKPHKDEIHEDAWWDAVQCFFRRSRIYLRLARRQSVTLRQCRKYYLDAFRNPTDQVTYLAPIPVAFGEEQLDFGLFRIQRFAYDTLDDLLQTDVNKVFYRRSLVEASCRTFDHTYLGDYWYIVFSRTRAQSDLVDFVRETFTRRLRHAPAYLEPLESVLAPLVLFKWEASPHHDLPLKIPLVIAVPESLIAPPFDAPVLSSLTTESLFDWQEGQLQMDDEGTRRFVAFVRSGIHKLLKVKSKREEWSFFENALGFLTKGFFTTDLEQLLWHVTALEALFGENLPGVKQRLARRIGSVLGPEAGRRFLELYDYRSSLVHGNAKLVGKRVPWEKLNEARDLALGAVVWMLNCLYHIQVRSAPGPPLPRREEILEAIDKYDRPRLLRALPSGFPHVPSWTSL